MQKGMLVAASLAALGLAGCGGSEGPQGTGRAGEPAVLKLGHCLDTTHPVHKAMEYMAQRLDEKSEGRLAIQIFPSEQLGSEREMIEQVQLGTLDMVKTSTAPLESFVPIVGVFSVPYVFRDADHLWNVLLGPIGDRILASGVPVGLRGLCFYDAGSRSFYTKDKPVLAPEDLTGMKIRVMQAKTAMDMIEALGASPTPIAWGELYTSLQQGVVDGAENNPPSFQTSRHYEVCKHYALNEHTRVPDVVLVSEATWSKFSPEDRAMIQEAADESCAFQRELWKEKTDEALEAVQAAGVTVYRPDPTPFREKVRPMHAAYAGTPIGALMKEIEEVR